MRIEGMRLKKGDMVKVIAGKVGGVTGSVRDVITDPEYLDVTVPPGEAFSHATPRGHPEDEREQHAEGGRPLGQGGVVGVVTVVAVAATARRLPTSGPDVIVKAATRSFMVAD